MANLETLELTIQGNAESAAAGIGTLITSLSSLSNAIIKPYSDLTDFNAALKETAKLVKGISVSDLSKTTNALKSLKGIKAEKITPLSASEAKEYAESMSKLDVLRKKQSGTLTDLGKALGATKENEYKIGSLVGRYHKLTDAINGTTESSKKLAKEIDLSDNNNKTALGDMKAQQAYDARMEAEKSRKGLTYYDKYPESRVLEKYRVESVKAYKAEQEALKQATSGTKEYKDAAEQASSAAKAENSVLNETSKITKETGEKTKELGATTKAASNEMSKSIKSVTKSAHGLLSTIGRIFKTMLIRTAIRALLKGAKEGLDNYYQYSKKMGLEFASSMDKIYKTWGQAKNQIGATLGAALNAVLPIINAVASAALVAFNALSALFALISGATTYSSATEGMNDYGSAIGGAGKAAKQWLGTFDELNVMTQNSGGGGGGGGGNFASMFKEMELPQWLIEWKPIIEAILAGTLGALILPKIFDWIKKIIDLFTGGGASDLLRFLKLIGNDGNGGNTFKFPEQPNYSPFPAQPTYSPFPAAPDYGKAATDMGILSAAAVAAAPAIERIVAALGALKGGIDVFEIIKTILTTLLTKGLGGSGIDVKVNREEWDNFVKEYNDWNKGKEINLIVNDDVEKITKLTLWLSEEDTKVINVKLENDIAAITQLMQWSSETETKTIRVNIDSDIAAITQITLWASQDETKDIKVTLSEDVEDITKLMLWTGTEESKYINLKFVDNGEVYGHLVDWINTEDTKIVNLQINNPDDSAAIPTTNNSTWFDDVKKWLSLSVNEMINEAFGTSLPKGFIPALVEWINGNPGSSPEKVDVNISDVIDFTGFDKLSSEERKKFVTSLFNAYGSSEAIAALKAAIPNISVNGIIAMTDWQTFTREEKFNFITALKDVFGANEAIEAAKNAGINVGALVSEGMGSADPKIRKEAQEWMKILQGEVGKDVKAPNIKGDKTKITNSGKEAYGWFTDKFKTAVKAKVETTKSNINKVKTAIDNAVKQARQVNVTVDGKIADSFVKTLGDKIKNTVQEKLNKVTVKVRTEIKAPNGANAVLAASGGTFSTGQMFIAREAGAELVGQIGNHTAVMNNEQIVESVSNGVYAANAEQNALLRQQNQILYSILAKTGNGIPGASSALGRVVSQSLDMYSTMTGGR